MVLVESKVLNTLPVGIYKEATANPSAEPRTPKAMSRVSKNGEEKALELFTREAALAADESGYKLHAAALKVCVIITGSHPIYPQKSTISIWLSITREIILHIVSWEPERRYHYSKMFCWEPEGRYHHRLCTAIAPFWFSTEHLWTAITPFWLSTDDMG